MIRDAIVPSRLPASLRSVVMHSDIDLGGNEGIEKVMFFPLGRIGRVVTAGDEHCSLIVHECSPVTLAEGDTFIDEMGRLTEQPPLPGFH
jgi:hypothetical protein